MKSKIVISESAYTETFNYFHNKGFEVITFKTMNKPYDAVADHPDMFMFYDELLFVERDVTIEGIKCSKLGLKYPDTVKFNLVKVDNKIICKYDLVDESIKQHIKDKYEIIDVNQGYAKCSTAVINNKIITSDKGIFNACKDKLDSLLISPGHIELPGLDYGFIGGTCVCVDDVVFFNGDITKHPDYQQIKTFIEQDKLKIEYVNKPLRDIGSFIIIERSE